MNSQNDKLRRAAILVDSLDPPAADALLEKMDDHQATRVRNAVVDLDDVQQDEREEVLDEFLGRQRRRPVSDDGVQLDVDVTADLNHTFHAPPPTISASLPFQFLHNTSGQALASFLQHEHPQTIAVVITHLTPERSADVIARLPAPQQIEVLRRVAELDETDPEILREIEQEMEALLASEIQTRQKRSAGLAALQSILSAANPTARAEIMSNLLTHDQQLAAQLTETSSGLAQTIPERTRTIVPSAESPTITDNIQDNLPDTIHTSSVEFDSTAAASIEPPSITTISLTFDALAAFDDSSLAQILNRADPTITLLALTGASPELIARIMKQLPADVAGQLREKIENSGPLRLRDIDQAQQMLADIAAHLVNQGDITAPAPQRFAAAA